MADTKKTEDKKPEVEPEPLLDKKPEPNEISSVADGFEAALAAIDAEGDDGVEWSQVKSAVTAARDRANVLVIQAKTRQDAEDALAAEREKSEKAKASK